MPLELPNAVAAFRMRVVNESQVGIWELDYSDVDLGELGSLEFDEAALIEAVVLRPDRFHDLLDKVRVISVNEHAARIAGYESTTVAAETRPIRFLRGSTHAARIAQLSALAQRQCSFERLIVGRTAAGAELRCCVYWQAIEIAESGLPSRVAVAVVESPQDAASATREG